VKVKFVHVVHPSSSIVTSKENKEMVLHHRNIPETSVRTKTAWLNLSPCGRLEVEFMKVVEPLLPVVPPEQVQTVVELDNPIVFAHA
jgi:hypothetical protein